jgi:hypothetical protein
MVEREIVGGSGGGKWQKIPCSHCKGEGKCDCYNCCREVHRAVVGTTLFNDDYIEEYKEKEIKVKCSVCKGLGFLLIDEDGNIKVPKIKE